MGDVMGMGDDGGINGDRGGRDGRIGEWYCTTACHLIWHCP